MDGLLAELIILEILQAGAQRKALGGHERQQCAALLAQAATWLDLCAGHLLGELEKQTVELYQRHGVLPGGSTDQDLIPITFERRDVEELIRGMRECSAELLQFAK